MFEDEQEAENAQRAFEDTIRKCIEGPDLHARAEGLMYFVRKYSSDPDKSAEVIPFALAAAELFKDLNLPMEQFAALWSVADAHRALSQTSECLKVCKEAYGIALENFASKEQAHMLNNIALGYLDQGEIAAAIANVSLSAQIWKSEDEPLEAAKALSLLAKVHYEANDFEESISCHDEAVELFKDADAHYRVLDSLWRKTDAQIRFGLWADALASHDLCLAHQRLLRQNFQKIPIQFNEARLSAFQKRHEEALSVLEEIINYWREQKNLEKIALASIEKSKSLYSLGRSAEAAEELRAVLLVSDGTKFKINREELTEQLAFIEGKAA